MEIVFRQTDYEIKQDINKSPKMNKYKVIDSVDPFEKSRKGENMCPCGAQMAGLMMGALFGLIADLFLTIRILTLFCISLGGAFATLGSQLENPFDILKTREFALSLVALFIITTCFSHIFPLNKNLGNIFVLSAVSNTVWNYTKPMLLILLSIVQHKVPWLASAHAINNSEHEYP